MLLEILNMYLDLYIFTMHNVQLLMKLDENNKTQRKGLDVEAMQKGQQVHVKSAFTACSKFSN